MFNSKYFLWEKSSTAEAIKRNLYYDYSSRNVVCKKFGLSGVRIGNHLYHNFTQDENPYASKHTRIWWSQEKINSNILFSFSGNHLQFGITQDLNVFNFTDDFIDASSSIGKWGFENVQENNFISVFENVFTSNYENSNYDISCTSRIYHVNTNKTNVSHLGIDILSNRNLLFYKLVDGVKIELYRANTSSQDGYYIWYSSRDANPHYDDSNPNSYTEISLETTPAMMGMSEIKINNENANELIEYMGCTDSDNNDLLYDISSVVLSKITDNNLSNNWNNVYNIISSNKINEDTLYEYTDLSGIVRKYYKLTFKLNNYINVSSLQFYMYNYNNSIDNGFQIYAGATGLITDASYTFNESNLNFENHIVAKTGKDFYDIKNSGQVTPITFNLNTRNTDRINIFFNTPYNTNSSLDPPYNYFFPTEIQINDISNINNNTLIDYIVPNFNNIDPRGYNPRSTRPIKWNYNRLINNKIIIDDVEEVIQQDWIDNNDYKGSYSSEETMHTSYIGDTSYNYHYLEVYLKHKVDVSTVTIFFDGADSNYTNKYFDVTDDALSETDRNNRIKNPRVWMSANGQIPGTPTFTTLDSYIIKRQIKLPTQDSNETAIPFDFNFKTLKSKFVDIYIKPSSSYWHPGIAEIMINNTPNNVILTQNTSIEYLNDSNSFVSDVIQNQSDPIQNSYIMKSGVEKSIDEITGYDLKRYTSGPIEDIIFYRRKRATTKATFLANNKFDTFKDSYYITSSSTTSSTSEVMKKHLI